ncbi:conserved hypothetical protein [Ricinus communis]|uniref:Trichome birefringence-like C-terminal domain-containing protein n=1 Tax=Ricinus communis TaxID=3988 RepID=B9SGK2_RICCO|nr:conserved hypothetical protein [Ricinus communis]
MATLMKRKQVFFRSISPKRKGEMWCYNRTQPIMDEYYAYAFPMPVQEIVERIIGGMKTPVRYLNITKLLEYRRDAHPAIYARKQQKLLIAELQQLQPESHIDCSHWCLPGLPDTWNKLLYAAIISESAPDITTSI